MENSRDQSKRNPDSKSKRRRNRKKEEEKGKKPKKERIMEIKKVAKEWEIWNEKEEVAKSEEEAKNLVPQRFYK